MRETNKGEGTKYFLLMERVGPFFGGGVKGISPTFQPFVDQK